MVEIMTQGMRAGGGVGMSGYISPQSLSARNTGSSPTLTPELLTELGNQSFNTVNQNFNAGRSRTQVAVGVLQGTGVNLMDNLWSSPLNPVGWVSDVNEPGSVTKMFSSDIQQFYAENQTLVDTTSGVIGAVLAATIGDKMLMKGAKTALAGSTALRGSRLISGSAHWDKAREAVLISQRTALISRESFGLLKTVEGRKFLGQAVVHSAVPAIRQEALVYGAMWNNEVINQEGIADDAFWSAAGLALGVGLGAIQARAFLIKSANSSETKAAIEATRSMAGISEQMTKGLDSSMVNSFKTEMQLTEGTVDITMWGIAARANSPEGVETPTKLLAEQNSSRARALAELKSSTARVLQKQIPGVTTESLPAADRATVQFLTEEVAKKDPWWSHGLSSMGRPAGDIQLAVKERTAWLAKETEEAAALIKSPDPKKAAEGTTRAQRASALKNQQPMVLLNGRWVNAESKMVGAAQRFDQALARQRITPLDSGLGLKIQLPHLGEVVFDAAFGLRTKVDPLKGTGPAGIPGAVNGKKINYSQLEPGDRLYVQEAMGQLIKQFVAKGDKATFVVTKTTKGDWLALDLADQIIEAGGKVKFADDAGIATRSELQRESVRLKARALIDSSSKGMDIDDSVRLRYNLPGAAAMERLEDPNGTAFRTWLDAAASDEGTAFELAEALARQRVVEGVDLMPLSAGDMPGLHGDMLKWSRNKDGDFVKPLLGFHKPPSEVEKISRRGHEEAAQIQTSSRVAVLLDPENQNGVTELARELVQMPEMPLARKSTQLADEQVTGLGGGVGQALSEVLPRSFLSRFSPVVQAARRLHDTAMRIADKRFMALMEATGMRNVITNMDTPGKAALHAQLDQFASLRGGWDLLDSVDIGGGFHAFQLADTPSNRKLLGVEKISDGDFMPNLRTGKPIVMGQEALEALSGFQAITKELLKGTNTIRKARGLSEIVEKNLFMPSPDTKGKMVGFMFDENNEMVQMRTIVASSQAEYEAMSKLSLSELPNGYTIRTQQQMEGTRDVWDDAMMDWMDQGYSSATASRGTQTGGLTGAFVRQGAFLENLEWVKRQTRQQANETLQTLMMEPLKLARINAVVSDPLRDQMMKAGANRKVTRNVFDEYEMALTGKSKSFRESSLLAKAVDHVEQAIDRVLASSAIHIPVSHVMDVARRFGVSPKKLSQTKTYDDILSVMGEHSPFKDQMDYLAQQGFRPPTELRGITNGLNKLATNLVLRWDPFMAHATMNMLGLIPTISAGVRAGSAPMTTALTVKGRSISTIDGMKIIQEGIRDLRPSRRPDDWAWMVAHGDAKQSTFEYQQALDAVKSQAGFFKWAGKIDKWVSKASEGSENLSRQIAHLTGLRLADAQGIKGMAARHGFAREFADAAIANYTPSNRPELFNTAFGSSFGLFQSYMTSQTTKMFHWLEDGNYRAVATQASWQASLFGLGNTYGVGTLLGMHDSFFQETGEPSIIDAAYNTFGPDVGGALMTGGFGALTGIALWTRGDVNIRLPLISGQLPAGPDVFMRLGRMITGTASNMLSEGPIDSLSANVELVQREMPNRILKGMIAVTALGGTETDRFGAVMSDTVTTMDTIARVAGVRSKRMQQELEVFYANASDVDKDAARAESVRHRFRTDARAAQRTGAQIDPMLYFDDYVASGGNPQRFKSWLKQNIEDATTVRTARQLKKNLATDRNKLALWRYGAYGAWGVEDGSTPVKP